MRFKQFEQELSNLGWSLKRSTGGHRIFAKQGRSPLTVKAHGDGEMNPHTIEYVLKQAAESDQTYKARYAVASKKLAERQNISGKCLPNVCKRLRKNERHYGSKPSKEPTVELPIQSAAERAEEEKNVREQWLQELRKKAEDIHDHALELLNTLQILEAGDVIEAFLAQHKDLPADSRDKLQIVLGMVFIARSSMNFRRTMDSLELSNESKAAGGCLNCFVSIQLSEMEEQMRRLEDSCSKNAPDETGLVEYFVESVLEDMVDAATLYQDFILQRSIIIQGLETAEEMENSIYPFLPIMRCEEHDAFATHQFAEIINLLSRRISLLTKWIQDMITDGLYAGSSRAISTKLLRKKLLSRGEASALPVALFGELLRRMGRYVDPVDNLDVSPDVECEIRSDDERLSSILLEIFAVEERSSASNEGGAPGQIAARTNRRGLSEETAFHMDIMKDALAKQREKTETEFKTEVSIDDGVCIHFREAVGLMRALMAQSALVDEFLDHREANTCFKTLPEGRRRHEYIDVFHKVLDRIEALRTINHRRYLPHFYPMSSDCVLHSLGARIFSLKMESPIHFNFQEKSGPASESVELCLLHYYQVLEQHADEIISTWATNFSGAPRATTAISSQFVPPEKMCQDLYKTHTRYMQRRYRMMHFYYVANTYPRFITINPVEWATRVYPVSDILLMKMSADREVHEDMCACYTPPEECGDWNFGFADELPPQSRTIFRDYFFHLKKVVLKLLPASEAFVMCFAASDVREDHGADFKSAEPQREREFYLPRNCLNEKNTKALERMAKRIGSVHRFFHKWATALAFQHQQFGKVPLGKADIHPKIKGYLDLIAGEAWVTNQQLLGVIQDEEVS